MFKSSEERAKIRQARADKKAKIRQARADEIAQKKFEQTPAGQASIAFSNGNEIFQYVDCIEATQGVVVPMMGAYAKNPDGEIRTDGKGRGTTISTQPKTHLEKIEAQGWSLFHAGYVFQELGSESRDKFLESGQNVAVSGRVLGVYIFRRNENNREGSGGIN